MRTCQQLKPGEQAKIVDVTGDAALRSRFAALGLRPGNQISLIRRAPLGCPIEVAVRHTHIALRAEDAAKIQVSPLPL